MFIGGVNVVNNDSDVVALEIKLLPYVNLPVIILCSLLKFQLAKVLIFSQTAKSQPQIVTLG